MNTWSSLVRSALLGTRRQPLEAVAGDSPLDHLLRQLPADDPDNQLLSAAGATVIYQQIGSGSSPYPYNHNAAAPITDPRPTCGPVTSYLLAGMLRGRGRSHLPECLTLLSRQGQRLPASLVPNFLALGSKTPALRPLIIPLLSATGRHLATMHPEWLYAAPACETWNGAWKIWQESTQVSKTRFIQQLRASNPELGRQLIESTWKAENDAARMNFIKQLTTGISKADEPFLEQALDDRNFHVRRQAAELLAAVPESRLGQRMIGHTKSFLGWTGAAIQIRFPQLTPTMIHDGIYGMQSKKPAHVRSKQLIQMVGAVPLIYWTTHWHPEPETIISAAMRTNWKRTLTSGFADAAHRQQNSTWAKAILWGRGPGILPIKLLDILTIKDYSDWLDHLLYTEGRPDLNYRRPLHKSIRHRTGLNDAQTMQVFRLIADYMATDKTKKIANATEKRTFEAVALRCPLSILPQAERLLGESTRIAAIWQATAAKMLDILHFRQEMMIKVMNGE